MAKTKQKLQLQKRDWAIIVLFLIVIGTNWVWYEVARTHVLIERNSSSAWLQQQVQINKLKACIDEGKKPCDITPPQF